MSSRAIQLHLAPFADLATHTLYQLLKLRADVFVVEQKCVYPDLDGRDLEPDTWHLWLSADGEPVAYLRILAEPEGGYRIGRVVVAPSARGVGYAGWLMDEALAVVGARPCVLDAQAHLVDFYARYGFVPAGAEYLDDGIPHQPMRRSGGATA